MNKALRLTITNKAEDELRSQLGSDMRGLEDHLLDKISSFQSYLNESIDKISLSLKQAAEMEAAAAAVEQGGGSGGGPHVAPLFASFDNFPGTGTGGEEGGEGTTGGGAGAGPVSGMLSRRLSTRQSSLGMKSARLPSASGERHA
jgi:hypothetical protein